MDFIKYVFFFILCFCFFESTSQENLAITNVNVIPMTANVVLPDQVILISDGRIEKMGNAETIKIPDGYKIIDGTGKFILPGLINMYTHANESNLLLYLANGQTTIRDIPSHINILGLREQIKKDKLIGPRILSYGLRATGAPAPYHSQQPIFTPDQGREQVREAKRLGYDGMYIYATCLPSAYEAILEEAEKINLPISGHFPIFVEENKALQSRQAEYTNLTGITRRGRLSIDKNKLISELKKYNKAITPSLVVHRTWSLSHKDSLFSLPEMDYIPVKLKANWKPENNNRSEKSSYPYKEVAALIKELSDKGVQLFLGSDGGFPLVIPGFAFLEEMELFVAAGISNYKTLKFATADAAKFLNLKDVGTLEVGKRAELILLGSNPLENIKNIRTIEGVSIGKRWLTKAFFEEELNALKQDQKLIDNRFEKWKGYLEKKEETTELNYTFYTDTFEVGQQKILIDSLTAKSQIIRSVMVADSPDYRETYSCHRIRNGKVDSLFILNKGGEGNTQIIVLLKQDSVSISGFSPFHGEFNYSRFAPPKTQLWGPFISRYFELDNVVNYHLSIVLNSRLEKEEAQQFKTIQIELNSEEYAEEYIVDEAMVTIIKLEDNTFRVIYPGFSGFSNRTSLPFNVLIKTDALSNIQELIYDKQRIVRDN